jgi:hypothetical protein
MTLRFHLIPVRIAIIKIKNTTDAGKDVGRDWGNESLYAMESSHYGNHYGGSSKN